MILRKLFLMLVGSTYGFLSAAGVFTVLAAVGLVPRFAGRTHTADRVWLYEEMVIWGTVFGCYVSVFEERCGLYAWLLDRIVIINIVKTRFLPSFGGQRKPFSA